MRYLFFYYHRLTVLAALLSLCPSQGSHAQTNTHITDPDLILDTPRKVFSGNIKLYFTLNDFSIIYFKRNNPDGSADIRWQCAVSTNSFGETLDPVNQFRIINKSKVYNIYPKKRLTVHLSYLDNVPPMMYGEILSSEPYKTTRYISTIPIKETALQIVSISYNENYVTTLFEIISKSSGFKAEAGLTNTYIYNLPENLFLIPIKSIYYINQSSKMPAAVSTMNLKGDYLDQIVYNLIETNPDFREDDFIPDPSYDLITAKTPTDFASALSKYSVLEPGVKPSKKPYPMFDTDPVVPRDTGSTSDRNSIQIVKKIVNEQIDRETKQKKLIVNIIAIISTLAGWFFIFKKRN